MKHLLSENQGQRVSAILPKKKAERRITALKEYKSAAERHLSLMMPCPLRKGFTDCTMPVVSSPLQGV